MTEPADVDGNTTDASGPDRPTFVPPKQPDAPMPARVEPIGRRRHWWITAGVVVVGSAVAVTVIATTHGPSTKDHTTPRSATPANPSPPVPALPLNAVHDSHGQVTTLPDIRRILGSVPIPGVPLGENTLNFGDIDGNKVTNEENNAVAKSASQNREFTVKLTRWTTSESFEQHDHEWARVGLPPHRKNAQDWSRPAIHITGLGDAALIYQEEINRFPKMVSGHKIEYDDVFTRLEVRYKNVMIDMGFSGVDFTTDRAGKVKQTQVTYSQAKRYLTGLTRQILEHL